MRFESPALFNWAWLLVPVVLLFLFRRRPKRLRVTTLAFFKSLAAIYQESPWLRRLKRLVAVLLAVGTVLLGAGALADPVSTPEVGDVKSVIVLVDGSASMRARRDGGATRIEEARDQLASRLTALSSGVSVLVMRYDRRPEVVLPHSRSRREVIRALDQIVARPIEGDPAKALSLAFQLASIHRPSVVWHVTDAPTGVEILPYEGPPASAQNGDSVDLNAAPEKARAEIRQVRLPEDVRVEVLDVSLSDAVNAGITAFQIRRQPLERSRHAAFVELHAVGGEAVETELAVYIDDTLTTLRSFAMKPGTPERVVLPLDANRGERIRLEVRADGDVLPDDDVVIARMPRPQPIRLLWVREAPDPFTQLALASIGEDGVLEAYQAKPDAWPLKESFDVVLFDGWLPPRWPTNVSTLVLRPPGAVGPIRAAPLRGMGLPVSTLRAINASHPVLYGVANERVALTQVAALEADGPLLPLWVGPRGPLLLAGDVGGQRIVVFGFAPERSERLPLMASYPLLVGNAIYWAADDGALDRTGPDRRTGDVLDVTAPTVAWTPPGGPESTSPLPTRVLELDRVGLFRVGEIEGSASLQSRKETSLQHGAEDTTAANENAVTPGSWRRRLMWSLLAFLLLEAFLFHRRGVF